MTSKSLAAKYRAFDRLEDSDDEEDKDAWRLSEAEIKARREKKRDALIQKELDAYKEIDAKLERAAKLPALRAEPGYYTPPTEAGSWSEGRDDSDAAAAKKKGPASSSSETLSSRDREALDAKVRDVEAVLAQLAADADFQTDLRRPSLQTAIKHWTNEQRLPRAQALALFDEDSFEFRQFLKPALDKIARLQSACHRAAIGVPIDAVLKGRATIFEKPPVPRPHPDDVREAEEPAPRELTAAERKAEEKRKRDAALKDFEAKIMEGLPPPEPFSWRKLGRQLVIQLGFMAVVLAYFHFVMRPKLEKQLLEAQHAQEAKDRAAEMDFPFQASSDGEEAELGGFVEAELNSGSDEL